MNKKLTFPELAEMLSGATNTSKRLSELMLRELFAVIAERLIDGESVKIDGLGVFGVSKVGARRSVNVNTGEMIEIPGHNKVSFTPDKRLAEAVNAPFASFEAVVLNDEVTSDMLNTVDSQPDATSQPDAEAVVTEAALEAEPTADAVAEPAEPEALEEAAPETEPEPAEPEAEPTADEEAEPAEPEAEPTADAATEPTEPETLEEAEPEAEPTADAATEPAEPEAEADEPEEANNVLVVTPHDDDCYYDDEVSWWHRHGAIKGFILGVVCGVAGVYFVNFFIDYMRGGLNPKPAEEYVEESDSVLAADTIMEETDTTIQAVSEPDSSVKNGVEKSSTNNKVVTDTVTGSYFLTRMARKHYGNGHFWVYIYEENKNVISNPNNVKPGTVVIVPDAKKYGIDKDDKQSVEAAKKKEGEILSKYL
ncbi:MAG: HU family DNA-binding protein [Muribaculaceae bacterium]